MARPAHSLYVRLRRPLAGARRVPRQYKASHEAIPPGAIVRSDRVRLGWHKSDLSSVSVHFRSGSRVDGALARTFRRLAALVGCGHVSGLLERQVVTAGPNALRGTDSNRKPALEVR